MFHMRATILHSLFGERTKVVEGREQSSGGKSTISSMNKNEEAASNVTSGELTTGVQTMSQELEVCKEYFRPIEVGSALERLDAHKKVNHCTRARSW